MTDFTKEDPQFRVDILASGFLRRVVETRFPALRELHSQLSPTIDEVLHEVVGPKAIEKRFGLKVKRVVKKQAGAVKQPKAKRAKRVKVEVLP